MERQLRLLTSKDLPTRSPTPIVTWPTTPLTTHIIKLNRLALSQIKPTAKFPQLHTVANFLHKLKIQPREPEDSGITWLELLIAYEHTHGEFCPPPVDPDTLKPIPNTRRHKANQLLRTFKLTVRFVIRRTATSQIQACFKQCKTFRLDRRSSPF